MYLLESFYKEKKTFIEMHSLGQNVWSKKLDTNESMSHK